MLKQAKKHPDKALELLRQDMLDWLGFPQASIDMCWMAVRVLKYLDIYETWQQQQPRPVAGQPAVRPSLLGTETRTGSDPQMTRSPKTTGDEAAPTGCSPCRSQVALG